MRVTSLSLFSQQKTVYEPPRSSFRRGENISRKGGMGKSFIFPALSPFVKSRNDVVVFLPSRRYGK